MQQRWARRLLAGYLLALAVLTVIPLIGPTVTDLLVQMAETWGAAHSPRTTELVDAVTNVVLFLPAGLLLGLAVPRFPAVVTWLLCLTASVAVEVTQLIAVPGRDASPADVATNALGAAVGVLLAAALRRRSPAR